MPTPRQFKSKQHARNYNAADRTAQVTAPVLSQTEWFHAIQFNGTIYIGGVNILFLYRRPQWGKSCSYHLLYNRAPRRERGEPLLQAFRSPLVVRESNPNRG